MSEVLDTAVPKAAHVWARNGNDFYREPRWAADALFAAEPFREWIWDPACGTGNILKSAEAAGHVFTVGTDIVDRGYAGVEMHDFTHQCAPLCVKPGMAVSIVTNPPFALAETFIERALALADLKVAMLLRLAFLEGWKRHERIFSKTPLARVLVFRKRLSMLPGEMEVAGKGGTTAFAWFVWHKDHRGEPTIGWL
jgi:hypothetical protein